MFLMILFLIFTYYSLILFYNIQNDACLGFFNVQTQEWECEDECLTKEGNTFCGDTGKYKLLFD